MVGGKNTRVKSKKWNKLKQMKLKEQKMKQTTAKTLPTDEHTHKHTQKAV